MLYVMHSFHIKCFPGVDLILQILVAMWSKDAETQAVGLRPSKSLDIHLYCPVQ
jgi:hypothetical protein